MKKVFALLIAIAMIGVSATACSSTNSSSGTDSGSSSVSGTITASGSSALYPLVNDAANKFKAINKNLSITVNAGGSGTGLQQVAAGTVDIGNSDIFAAQKLTDATQIKSLVDHRICVIGVAPVVHPDVAKKVTNLTRAQLTDIFTGKIKNWKDVGGDDLAIVLVTRPASSGTRAIFKQYVMNGAEEVSNASLETDDSGTLAQNVQNTKGAIGYLALSYMINNASIKTVSVDGVAPTVANIYSGTYTVWGYEHMYTKGTPTGAVKAFIEYIESSDYTAAMETLGYGLTSKLSKTATDSHAAEVTKYDTSSSSSSSSSSSK